MSHPIGYVAKVFPRVSETFVINELRAIEEAGECPAVFSLHRNPAPVAHAILAELQAPIRYVEDVEVEEREVKRAIRRLAEEMEIPEAQRPRILPRKYVRLAVALAQLGDEFGVEHWHAHFASRAGHVAALASVLSGRKYSMTAHAKDIYHHDVDRDLLLWKMRRASFVITVTEFNRSYLQDLLGSGESTGATVIRLYNGVDLTRFVSHSPTKPRPARIIAIGRLVEKKGFDVLVDACAILRDRAVEFACEIVGGGDLATALREQIAEHGLSALVSLAGSCTTEEVGERLGLAAVVALPCVIGADGNVDALPTALLEGMACGLPLVSTRISGIPEIIVHEENGLLVDPGDSEQLALALESILRDPDRAMALGVAGRTRAENLFDLRRNAAQLVSYFRTLGGLRAGIA